MGRFKVIQTSVALLIASSLLNVLLALLHDYLTSPTDTTFVLLIEGLCWGQLLYVACILPLIGDQLIGASGDQLSFAMYWIMWGFVIAVHTEILNYISFHYSDSTRVTNFTAKTKYTK